ncbi:hypothetical protein BDZ89DRAFT_679523 [Hymenopellis radicata]|nr:hypothetical protein BDZ89DRAFT_679523 [Hymenopellis radicata]
MSSPTNSSPKPRKAVRFADSPNESYYNYDSDSASSPVTTRTNPFTFPVPVQPSPPSTQVYNSRSLNDTPSPVYVPTGLPASPVRDYMQRRVSPMSPIQSAQPSFVPSHDRAGSASSTSSYTPLEVPPTPNLRPIALPQVDDAQAQQTEPLTINLHSALSYGGVDVDLTDINMEHIIASLPLEPAVTPPRATMILQSSRLPWKVHVEMPAMDLEVTVQDVVASLYSALRMPVTETEANFYGEAKARSIQAAFSRRVQNMGEREKQRGPRRIDFLSRNTRFLGLVPTESDPNIWKICLDPRQR